MALVASGELCPDLQQPLHVLGWDMCHNQAIFAEVVLHVLDGKLSPWTVESPMVVNNPPFQMSTLNTP